MPRGIGGGPPSFRRAYVAAVQWLGRWPLNERAAIDAARRDKQGACRDARKRAAKGVPSDRGSAGSRCLQPLQALRSPTTEKRTREKSGAPAPRSFREVSEIHATP